MGKIDQNHKMEVLPGQRWKRNDIIVEVLKIERLFIVVKVIQNISRDCRYIVGSVPHFSSYKFEHNTTDLSDKDNWFEYLHGQDKPK